MVVCSALVVRVWMCVWATDYTLNLPADVQNKSHRQSALYEVQRQENRITYVANGVLGIFFHQLHGSTSHLENTCVLEF